MHPGELYAPLEITSLSIVTIMKLLVIHLNQHYQGGGVDKHHNDGTDKQHQSWPYNGHTWLDHYHYSK